jgi:hypothetical protein
MGPTPGQKPHLHPTDLMYSTPMYSLQGLGVYGLVSGSSSAPDWRVVYVPGGTFICRQKWSIKSMRLNIQQGQVFKT